jgi:hypothetical protein
MCYRVMHISVYVLCRIFSHSYSNSHLKILLKADACFIHVSSFRKLTTELTFHKQIIGMILPQVYNISQILKLLCVVLRVID